VDDKNTKISKSESSGDNDSKMQILVNDCKVTLSFNNKPDEIVINEIKNMLLTGLIKNAN